MRILQPSEINTKKMRHGLNIRPPKSTDYRLGGISGIDRKILCPDGNWLNHLPVFELQRNKVMDVYGCVSFADNNVDEILYKKQFGTEVNYNDRFLVVGSGTKPDVGNSPLDVAEWKRKNGVVVGEEKWPLTDMMTSEEYYNNGFIPLGLLQEGKASLVTYDFTYELGDCGMKGGLAYFIYEENMLTNLQYSPVACSVYGQYNLDANGYIATPSTNQVTHQIVVVAPDENKKFWYVFDSESSALVTFNWNYPFQFPILKYLKKKNTMNLYKKKGQSGICVKAFGEDLLLPFNNADIFKSVYGGKKFVDLGGQYVDEWPYPLANAGIDVVQPVGSINEEV